METPTQEGGDSGKSVDQIAQQLQERWKGEEPETEKAEEVEEVEAPEAEASTDEVDAEETEEEARFETLTELAEAADMDFDEFMSSIKATVKVNGEQSEVSLSDLSKGYQLESDYTRKNMEFVEQKRQFDEFQQKAQTELQAQLERAGHVFNMAQQQLMHEYSATNWEQLKADDLTQFMLKQNEFGKRQAQLNQAIQQAEQQANAFREKQKEEADAKQLEYLQRQDELLLSALPDWKNDKVREEQSKKVAEYLIANGFTPEETGNISDHRILLMAHKAMKNDVMAQETDVAKKKVVKSPKLVKANARQDDQFAQKKVKRLKAKLKSTGDLDDAAQLLLARKK